VWSVCPPLAGLAERAGAIAAHPTSFSAIAPQVEILAIATSSHKFQCDRPSITFPEFSLEAIAPPTSLPKSRTQWGDRV